jgi:hypothetical protein
MIKAQLAVENLGQPPLPSTVNFIQTCFINTLIDYSMPCPTWRFDFFFAFSVLKYPIVPLISTSQALFWEKKLWRIT